MTKMPFLFHSPSEQLLFQVGKKSHIPEQVHMGGVWPLCPAKRLLCPKSTLAFGMVKILRHFDCQSSHQSTILINVIL